MKDERFNHKTMPDGSGALEFDKRWDIETNDKPKSKGSLRVWLIGALGAAGLLGGVKGLEHMKASSQVGAKPVPVSFVPDAVTETPARTAEEILAAINADNDRLRVQIAAQNTEINAKTEQRAVNAETIAANEEANAEREAEIAQLNQQVNVLTKLNELTRAEFEDEG